MKDKKIDKRENLRVVTDNRIIEAQDLPKLSLNAKKLFFIAVAQCRRNDTTFYEYETTPIELAEMWGVSRQDVYSLADKITTELMKIVITLPNGEKGFKKRHLFEKCDYDDDSVLTFKLHSEMTDLLLGLKKNFSKPLVWDFMKMKSPYSMAIWHLFQREMKSFKPMINSPIEFEISLDDLRKVTGLETKFNGISEFKRFVLDKAIAEIKRNCLTDITYVNIKRGRTVIGFRFTAKSIFELDAENLSYRTRLKLRKADLARKEADGTLTFDEQDELNELRKYLSQMTLEDYSAEV